MMEDYTDYSDYSDDELEESLSSLPNTPSPPKVAASGGSKLTPSKTPSKGYSSKISGKISRVVKGSDYDDEHDELDESLSSLPNTPQVPVSKLTPQRNSKTPGRSNGYSSKGYSSKISKGGGYDKDSSSTLPRPPPPQVASSKLTPQRNSKLPGRSNGKISSKDYSSKINSKMMGGEGYGIDNFDGSLSSLSKTPPPPQAAALSDGSKLTPQPNSKTQRMSKGHSSKGYSSKGKRYSSKLYSSKGNSSKGYSSKLYSSKINSKVTKENDYDGEEFDNSSSSLSKTPPTPHVAVASGGSKLTPKILLKSKEYSSKTGGRVAKRKGSSFQALSVPNKSNVLWPKQGVLSSPRDRELSANRHAIKKLQSTVTDIRRELDEKKKENKLLNRLQIRQAKDLNRYQALDGEMPQLLQRHSEEIRVLKEHLRRSLETSQAYQKQLEQYRKEMLKLGDTNKRLEDLAGNKRLVERERLTQQVLEANTKLKEKDNKIKELRRAMEVLEKNHIQDFRSHIHRNKSLTKEIEELREHNERLQLKLKEREKELVATNIYSQRFGGKFRYTHQLPAMGIHSKLTQTERAHTNSDLKSTASQVNITPSIKCTHSQSQTKIQLDPKSKNLEVKLVGTKSEAKLSKRASDNSVRTGITPTVSSATDQEDESLRKKSSSVKFGEVSKSPAPSIPPSAEAAPKQNVPLEKPAEYERSMPSSAPKTALTLDGSIPSSAPKTALTLDRSIPSSAPKTALTLDRSIPSSAPKTAQTLDRSIPSSAPKTDVPLETPDHSIPSSAPRTNISAQSSSKQATKTDIPLKTSAELERERKKKEELLAKLRAIDGIKGPPGSQHVPSASVKSSALHTSNQVIGSYEPSGMGRTSTEPQPPPAVGKVSGGLNSRGVSNISRTYDPVNTSTNVEEEAELKKQQLLAKLMATDNRHDTAKNSNKFSSAGKSKAKQEGGHDSSNTSTTQSWPHVIENLHNGKPAYSTENDPLGSKHASRAGVSVTKDSALTNSRNAEPHDFLSGLTPKKDVTTKPLAAAHGRRATRNNIMKTETFGNSDSADITKRHNQQNASNYPWEVEVEAIYNEEEEQLIRETGHSPRSENTKIESPGRGTGRVRKSMDNSNQLLPHRQRKSMTSFEVIPGSTFEPDDLEELVL